MAIILNNAVAPIQTVSPQLNIGEIQLSADQRNSKEKKLTDAERIRRVVLPANFWGELQATHDNNKSAALNDILRAALVKIGSDKLRDKLEETPMLREIALSEFTVSSLLAWSEETATSRGSITFTRAEAEAWLAASATLAAAKQRWTQAGKDAAFTAAAEKMLANRFGALAAKNHGIAKQEDADKLLALVSPDDTSNPIAEAIIGRLTHISKTLAAKAAEATISMDDL